MNGTPQERIDFLDLPCGPNNCGSRDDRGTTNLAMAVEVDAQREFNGSDLFGALSLSLSLSP